MNIVVVVCIVMATSFLSVSGEAASFNCARAITAHEKYVCNDQVINAADTLLGTSYRAAVSVFPIKGFVQATQQRFLLQYPYCRKMSEGCLNFIMARVRVLESMKTILVYTNVEPWRSFTPDDGVLWVSHHDDQPTLHYFGSYMPDMVNPEPFPAGFVCDDVITLRQTPSGWAALNSRDEVSISDTGAEVDISCSPRNALRGHFGRVR